ncbi:MAG: NAD(+)/NADH kinase [Firmicutes bacterium]|jgi:NAD+ kinase|nr:NAD(+)/NADH kinase [Bacillota bacterium]MDH7495083.1 NAD(+)/NADH kinase [Bacillota bacterium]
MRIGLITHIGKRTALDAAREVLKFLPARGAEAFLDPESARELGLPHLSFGADNVGEKLDLAVVLGGDGALLNAARRLAGSDVPILGVNVGHLGFLTEVELPGLYDALDAVLGGRYTVEERMMLRARVTRAPQGQVADFVGLNDVVVTKGAFARMIRLETYIGPNLIGTYPADGAIVASPTGSTGYSLSAGGPIVDPAVDTLIVTFICPHTLAARSFVASRKDTVRIVLSAPNEEVMLTVDGQVGFRLENRDEVWVGAAAERTRLVKLGRRSFYEVLRTRLAEGNV